MSSSQELFFFVSFVGAFNSLLLGFYFLRKQNLSAAFFGLLLICLGIRTGKSVLLYFHPETPKIVLQVGLSACFFIGPALYFFLKSEIESVRSVSRPWTVVWLMLIAGIVATGVIFPYQAYPHLWNGYIVSVIYTGWGVFILLSGLVLYPILQRKPSPTETWYLMIFSGNLLIFIAYLAALLLPSRSVYISGAITFSTLFYTLLVAFLVPKKRTALFSFSPKQAAKKSEPEHAETILNLLKSKMAAEQLYKNPSLKLGEAAAAINIPAHQLSQLLNENLNKNFPEFVNEYRVDEACQMLFTHDNLSIDGIGHEVGFRSKSTFFATFKKHKGVTPAVYRQTQLKIGTDS